MQIDGIRRKWNALKMVSQNTKVLECTATFSKFSAQLQNLNFLKEAFVMSLPAAIFCCSELFRNLYTG